MNNEIVEGLKPLFEQAEKENLWFYSNYQDLWLSPTELKKAQSEGRFVWGAVNWQLRNPNEELTRMNTMIENTKKNIEAFKKRMG